jgi:hypothetical protein
MSPALSRIRPRKGFLFGFTARRVEHFLPYSHNGFFSKKQTNYLIIN